MSDPFLALAGVRKAFGDLLVLDDVSVEVPEGEVLALLGPSGSGKTTLLRLLAGFEAADAGSIAVGGREVSHLPPDRRGFGMVFQHYALFPHLDVAANVAFGLRARGLGRAEAARRVEEVLELVGLAGYQHRRITEMSGGQQQRVAVARALAPSPPVLLLDEPLSNLDPTLRERTRRALKRVVHQVGITTVLVTHEQQEAFDLGDRVALLWQGRLQQAGPPEELYERPANREVAGFVGRANLLPGRFRPGPPAAVELDGAADGLAWPGEATSTLGAGQPVELMLRPEALAFAAPGEPGALAAQVVERLYLGGQAHYRLRTAGGLDLEVAAAPAAAREGDEVAVAPQPGGLAGRIWAREEEVPDREP